MKARILGRSRRVSINSHSLRRLVRECGGIEPGFAVLDEHARVLDQFYIATRRTCRWSR
jgi:hypothetical protein